MRVLFFFGGMPHYLVALLNAIQRKGIDVSVIIPSRSGRTIGKGVKMVTDGMEFKVIQLEEYQTFYRKPFFRGCIETLKTEKPDIVVLCWPYVLALVLNPLFWRFIKKNSIKIVLKEIPFQVPPYHGAFRYFKENPVYDENMVRQKSSGLGFVAGQAVIRLIRRNYYRKCHATVNYHDGAVGIQTSYGVAPDRIFISYNTPDTNDLFEARKQLESIAPVLLHNKHRLIHVGRLIKWKRVDMLVRVTAKLRLKYPSAELVIIGDGPEEASIRKEIEALGIQGAVIWPGSLYKYSDLGKYFLASSVYVLAGYGGLSINDAMGFGKAVVCSVADGTEKKLVRHGYNGLFFREEDEESLYSQLDFLFSHPSLMEEYGKNSEHIIRNEINIDSVSAVYAKAFEYVLNN